MTQSEGGPDDRGAPMRHWLIRFFEERPFTPFLIRMESGFEVRVSTPEALSFEPGILVLRVYDDADHFEVFPVDRIVSLKLLRSQSESQGE